VTCNVTSLKAFQETNIVQCCYITRFVYHWRNGLKNLVGIFHLLIGSRLLQISITLFDSSVLARIHTNGFHTLLELPQNVMYHVVFVRRKFQGRIRIVKIWKWQSHLKSSAGRVKRPKITKVGKTVESTNFTHSSRKAWSLLLTLGTDSNTGASSLTHQITANDISSRLQQVSKFPMDQSPVRSTKRSYMSET
jgi:hypothetical protein